MSSQMAQAMTPHALKENGMVFKNGRTGNLTKEERGVAKDKVEFRLGWIVEGKQYTTVIRSAASRGLARGKPARRRQDRQAPEDRGASKLSHQIIR